MKRVSSFICLVLLSSAMLGSFTQVSAANETGSRKLMLGKGPSGATGAMGKIEGAEKMGKGVVKVRQRQWLDAWQNRVTQRFERFDTFIAKLESRSEKLKAAGKDVTSLDAAISKLKELNTSAKAAAEAAKATLDGLNLDNPDTQVMETVKTELKKMEALFQPMLEASREAVKLARSITDGTKTETN